VHLQEAAARAVTGLIQRGGAASMDEPEVLSTCAATVDSPLGSALYKANSLCGGKGVEALLLCPRTALPAQGLEHHLIYISAQGGSSAAQLDPAVARLEPTLAVGGSEERGGDGDVLTQREAAAAMSRADMRIGHVSRAVPVDVKMADALSGERFRQALGGARVDHQFVVLCVNVALPATWLAASAGGKGSGREVRTFSPVVTSFA
jgi:hypothetical protein